MPESENPKQKTLVIAASIALAIGAGVVSYPYLFPSEPAPVPAAVTIAPTPKAPAAPVQIDEIFAEPEAVEVVEKTVEPSQPKPEPLPSLDDSDAVMAEKTSALLPQANGSSLWAINPEFLRKLVLAVDNLSRGEISYKYPPLQTHIDSFDKSVQGSKTRQDPPQYTMDSKSFSRYDNYVGAFAKLDPEALASLYRWSYPLLQQAYSELGNKEPSFNKVTLKAIDKLLAAPEVKGDIDLLRPSVMYQYLDPKLEKRSSSDKLMLRMGYDNNQKMKQALRQLRTEIASKRLSS